MKDVERRYLTAKNYERMVAKAAWWAWRKLPNHTKIWVSVEDMVEDGMRFVTLDVLPKWKEERGSMSTVITVAIYRYFSQNYFQHYVCQRRDESEVHSLDGLKELDPEIEDWVAGVKDGREEILKRLFVVAAVREVYNQATPELKEQITRWFFTGKRVHKKTREFRKVGREFRQKAYKIGLGFEDCVFLMNNPDCMNELRGRIGV